MNEFQKQLLNRLNSISENIKGVGIGLVFVAIAIFYHGCTTAFSTL